MVQSRPARCVGEESRTMEKRIKSEQYWRGLAEGVVADGEVSNDEILTLYRLLCEHGDLRKGPLADLKALIERICRDGEVTTNERQELQKFLKLFIRQKTANEKGFLFESFVVQCFDKAEYEMIEWRSDKFIPGWRPRSCQWPDIEMEHRSTGRRFAVECKFRSHDMAGRVDWVYPAQLDRYRAYESREGIPVFLALGFGGEADAPKNLYVVRLFKLGKAETTLRELEPFRVRGNLIELDLNETPTIGSCGRLDKQASNPKRESTKISQAELDQIVYRHGLYLAKLSGGEQADLSDANLSDARLNGVNLSRANLIGADLSEADLGGADLHEADLSDVKLKKANLSEANLNDAVLFRADLGEANLRDANLFRTDLKDAKLRGADLSGADLSEADLRGADLNDVDLGEIDWCEANLRGAKLRGAKGI
ncbi:MAG TPA: hypothetical protein DCM68_00065 [Verrucomicrobia bacterium]|nr:hypothetical protein [Verrucomicrobiota bacterium]